MRIPVGSRSLPFEYSMTWSSLTKYLLSLSLCQAVSKFYAQSAILVLWSILSCLWYCVSGILLDTAESLIKITHSGQGENSHQEAVTIPCVMNIRNSTVFRTKVLICHTRGQGGKYNYLKRAHFIIGLLSNFIWFLKTTLLYSITEILLCFYQLSLLTL